MAGTKEGGPHTKRIAFFLKKSQKNILKKELTKQPCWYNEVKLKDITFGNGLIDFRRFPL
jgi:hypothetical protein